MFDDDEVSFWQVSSYMALAVCFLVLIVVCLDACDKQSKCEAKGGVFIRGNCFDKSMILE